MYDIVPKSKGLDSAFFSFFSFIVGCCIRMAICFGTRNMQKQKKNKAAGIEGEIGVPNPKNVASHSLSHLDLKKHNSTACS